MTDYYETKSQPITKLMVWQAYKKVKSNKGSAGIDRMDWEELDSDLTSPMYKLLAKIYLHVTFDEWTRRFHPEKLFERYADDVVVHCKREKQAKFMLRQISQRMRNCYLELHPIKTKVVNLRGWSSTKYPRKYDFLGFTIKASMQTIKGRGAIPPPDPIVVHDKMFSDLKNSYI